MASQYRQALDELGAVFDRLDDGQVDRAVEMIADANKVVVPGGGREGLQIRGFAMRLFHLGRAVSVVGDMTTPAIGPGDLFLVTVGPGEISTALALIGVAKAGRLEGHGAHRPATRACRADGGFCAHDPGPDHGQ